MRKILFALALLMLSAAPLTQSYAEAAAGFGELYYEDTVVGTVVRPAASPKEGRDNLYGIPNQRAVIGVAPGDTDYHGGKWAVHVVVWTMEIEPYLLTSEEEVMDAYYDGHVSITRVMEADFKCPIQRKPKG